MGRGHTTETSAPWCRMMRNSVLISHGDSDGEQQPKKWCNVLYIENLITSHQQSIARLCCLYLQLPARRQYQVAYMAMTFDATQ